MRELAREIELYFTLSSVTSSESLQQQQQAMMVIMIARATTQLIDMRIIIFSPISSYTSSKETFCGCTKITVTCLSHYESFAMSHR